ncbi:MAG: hydroxyacid dehydrogenase [Chloroflexota bacterium]|nr:hydroxyacid dehydrogenase [Chloroflexota bacterium]
MSSPSKPIVAVLIPEPMRQEILSRESEELLAAHATIVSDPSGNPTDERLPNLIRDAVAAVTGWGTPPISIEALAAAPGLQLVAHTAGSIHKLVPVEAIENGLRITHAAAIIADSVAEIVIGQVLRFLRNLDAMDVQMKADGHWLEVRDAKPARLLGAQTIGIIGTGHVGRTVIKRLRAFESRILAADPFLSADAARGLGVTKASVDEIFETADIVSLHAPALPETEGMVGTPQLRALREGGLLINMSRGALVREVELIRELQTGRISAVLDVFAVEPLPIESPLRQLTNVYLSPHAAGHTVDTHKRQGHAMVEEVIRLLGGEELRYVISPSALATMA